MTRPLLTAVYVRLAALVLLIVGGWFAAADVFRRAETSLALALLRAGSLSGFDPTSRTLRLDGDLVLLLPDTSEPIAAHVTRSCSSLPAVLALAALALIVMPGSVRRRLAALAVSCAVLVAANTLRLAISLLLGARFGSIGLLLFHDFAGTVFVLAYTLVGFALLLRLHMPRSEGSSRYGDVL